MTQAYSEKRNPSALIRSRTKDLPITTSDAILLDQRKGRKFLILHLFVVGVHSLSPKTDAYVNSYGQTWFIQESGNDPALTQCSNADAQKKKTTFQAAITVNLGFNLLLWITDTIWDHELSRKMLLKKPRHLYCTKTQLLLEAVVFIVAQN